MGHLPLVFARKPTASTMNSSSTTSSPPGVPGTPRAGIGVKHTDPLRETEALPHAGLRWPDLCLRIGGQRRLSRSPEPHLAMYEPGQAHRGGEAAAPQTGTRFVSSGESDLDGIAPRGGANEHEASRRIKTEFLVQMDGMSSVTARDEDKDAAARTVMVLAATNYPSPPPPPPKRRIPRLRVGSVVFLSGVLGGCSGCSFRPVTICLPISASRDQQ